MIYDHEAVQKAYPEAALIADEKGVFNKDGAEIEIEQNTFTLTKNQSTFIPLKSKHRLINPGPQPLTIIEIQSGKYIGEDDIIRYKDKYGRI